MTEDMPLDENEDDAPGWRAIDEALARVYGDQQPLHFGPAIHYRIGGNDPIDGTSVYVRTSPVPHKHFVTYGLTDLYEKETDDPDESGFGFELTFRLASDPDAEPDAWVFNFLNNLARYVFGTGNVFRPGHYLNLNGPISLDHDTKIRAIAFGLDPELPPIDTPHGRVQFLQIVGITLDEATAIKTWNARGFLSELARVDPLLITDLGRDSIRANPDVARALDEGAAREGSSTGMLHASVVEWRQGSQMPGLEVAIGAQVVTDLKPILPHRLAHGQSLAIFGKVQGVQFVPSETASWRVDGDLAVIGLPAQVAKAFAESLQVRAGLYIVPGLDVVIRVVQSMIRDANGEVIEVVG